MMCIAWDGSACAKLSQYRSRSDNELFLVEHGAVCATDKRSTSDALDSCT